MRIHGIQLRRLWWLLPAIVVIVAGHLIVPFALSRTSFALTAGILLLIAAKHLGVAATWLGPFVSRLCRRR